MIFVDYIDGLCFDKIKCDGVIFSFAPFSCNYSNLIDKQSLNDLVSKAKSCNLKVAVEADRIIEEFEIKDYFSFLDYICNSNIDYLVFSDISTFSYFKRHKSDIKLIYDTKTMITNSSVSSCYNSLVNNEVICNMSNEITLEDLEQISKSSKTMIEIYGHHRIFYSRRTVFDSYKDYMTSSDIYYESLKGYEFRNKLLYIKEENRDSYYPIYQTKYGTFVFNSSRLLILEELDRLKDVCIYKINSLGLSLDELYNVSSIYYNYINGLVSLDDSKKMLLDICDNVSKDFLYHKSTLLK